MTFVPAVRSVGRLLGSTNPLPTMPRTVATPHAGAWYLLHTTHWQPNPAQKGMTAVCNRLETGMGGVKVRLACAPARPCVWGFRVWIILVIDDSFAWPNRQILRGGRKAQIRRTHTARLPLGRRSARIPAATAAVNERRRRPSATKHRHASTPRFKRGVECSQSGSCFPTEQSPTKTVGASIASIPDTALLRRCHCPNSFSSSQLPLGSRLVSSNLTTHQSANRPTDQPCQHCPVQNPLRQLVQPNKAPEPPPLVRPSNVRVTNPLATMCSNLSHLA